MTDTNGRTSNRTNDGTNSSLAGYRGRLSGSNVGSAGNGSSDGNSDGNDDLNNDMNDDMVWFSSEAALGESAEAVAYALRAFIASDNYPTLEQGGQREEVQVLNVEVTEEQHGTGGKTVSALLRRRPSAQEDQE